MKETPGGSWASTAVRANARQCVPSLAWSCLARLRVFFLAGLSILGFACTSAYAQTTTAAEERNPTVEYAIGVVGTIIVLIIACTPSRKR